MLLSTMSLFWHFFLAGFFSLLWCEFSYGSLYITFHCFSFMLLITTNVSLESIEFFSVFMDHWTLCWNSFWLIWLWTNLMEVSTDFGNENQWRGRYWNQSISLLNFVFMISNSRINSATTIDILRTFCLLTQNCCTYLGWAKNMYDKTLIINHCLCKCLLRKLYDFLMNGNSCIHVGLLARWLWKVW